MEHDRDRVTALLAEASSGERSARDAMNRLIPIVYDELRRMAHRQLSGDRGRLTLDTTALVHEAYLKLTDSDALPIRDRNYFFGAASRAMRQVLVDAARRRSRLKRGGKERPLQLEEGLVGTVDTLADDLLVLDDALERLGRDHARPARVLECRYFGGLSVEETAAVLDVAGRTVKRDFAFAKAWLRRDLSAGRGPVPVEGS